MESGERSLPSLPIDRRSELIALIERLQKRLDAGFDDLRATLLRGTCAARRRAGEAAAIELQKPSRPALLRR
jgi:hypothetical protein